MKLKPYYPPTPDEVSDPMWARLKQTVYIVEATRNEYHYLWEKYSTQGIDYLGKVYGYTPTARQKSLTCDWEQLYDGFVPMVGSLYNRPINVALNWAKLDGHLVVFHESLSQLVDHKMVERWLEEAVPHLFHKEKSRSLRTDATNFAHCLHHLKDLSKPS